MLDAKLTVKYDIIDNKDYDNLDINFFRYTLNGSLTPSQILGNNFQFSKTEGQSARSDLDLLAPQNASNDKKSLVETTTRLFSFYTTYSYLPKLTISLGLSHSERTFDTFKLQLASKESDTIPLKLIYKYSSKLNILYGVTYTDTEIGDRLLVNNSLIRFIPGYGTESLYYNVGFSGDILPKVSGSFDVGYRSLEFSTATKDYNSFGTTSSLAWEVTPKLRSTLNFSRNFDVSGAGSTFNANNFQLSNVYSINDEYKLSITLGYVDKEYRANPNRFLENLTREESLKNASVRLSYAPSRNFNCSASYNFIQADAGKNYGYDLSEYEITANIKY